ncbi:unnamed protein product, partial [Closterium sp. NIES-53]
TISTPKPHLPSTAPNCRPAPLLVRSDRSFPRRHDSSALALSHCTTACHRTSSIPSLTTSPTTIPTLPSTPRGPPRLPTPSSFPPASSFPSLLVSPVAERERVCERARAEREDARDGV